MSFLVDTGATSILNLKSFAESNSKEIRITSWSGTAATTASEILLPEFALGQYTLKQLKLPAIDLRTLAEACGCHIDGILGADLLERTGASIDLKRRVALLPPQRQEPAELAAIEQFRAHVGICLAAFNTSDHRALAGCIDPDIRLFTSAGEFSGRKAFLEYLQRRYFAQAGAPKIELQPHDVRLLADSAWFGYNYVIRAAAATERGRGMAIARRSHGQWALVQMHNLPEQPH
jgi:hypothetical protein